MKKILKSALLIMMGLVMFTSCEDDNDSNPIVKNTDGVPFEHSGTGCYEYRPHQLFSNSVHMLAA